MYFSDKATGLHLKEYTTSELVGMLRSAGFSHVAVPAPVPFVRAFLVFPILVATAIEAILSLLPGETARRVANLPVVWPLLGRVMATK